MTDRTVIVTGGSRGVGAGLVQAFLENGDRVATCSRSRTDQIAVWDRKFADRFLYGSLDASDRAASGEFVRGIVKRWGGVDVLVNNAGVARDGVLGIFPDDAVDAVVDLNLKGTIAITRSAVRDMMRHGSGVVVNVSSIVGLSGYRGLTVYGATKAALVGFTKALARELGSRGIRVNAVAPGYLRTEMTHGLDRDQMSQIVRRTPLGRLGEVEDVVAAVRFLASEDARFITGHVLVIDGGLTV